MDIIVLLFGVAFGIFCTFVDFFFRNKMRTQALMMFASARND